MELTFGLFVWFMILAHFVGDYVLQSRYLALSKGKEWYNMLVHCILYTGSISLVLIKWTGGFPFWWLLWIFVSHWIVDSWKCRRLEEESESLGKWSKKAYLYLDQLYHSMVLASVLIWYGWFG